MQAVLVMFRSDGERRSFSVTRDVTVIGRREDCDLRIPINDVSRKHARLIRDGDQLRIEDLGSSNGTHLNGQRIERDAELQAGDSVQVGPIVFVLQIDGYPSDEELNPVTAESAQQAAMLAPSAVPMAPGMPPLAPPLPGEEYEPRDAVTESSADEGLELVEADDTNLEPLPLEDDAVMDVASPDDGIELLDDLHIDDHAPAEDLLLDIDEPPAQKRH